MRINRGFSFVLVLALAILASTAPSLAQKVSTSFEPGTDFASLKSFAWHSDTEKRELTDQGIPIDRAIRSAVEDHLERRGMRKVDASEAAVLVNWVGTLYDRLALADRQKIRVSDTVSVGADPSLVGVNRSFKEGTLIIQIFATDGQTALWTGISSDTGTDEAWYKNGPKKAASLARKIVKQFPPK